MPRPCSDERGFVAADAIVALALLALLVGLVPQTVGIALRTSRAAFQMEEGRVQAQYLILTEWPLMRSAGERSGVAGDYLWIVRAESIAYTSFGPIPLCAVTSQVSQKTGRVQKLETVKVCSVEGLNGE